MRVPTRSDGIRSGVNWMRWNVPPSVSGQRGDGERLAEAGHALEQAVAAGQQGDEHPLEHPLLADHHAVQLVAQLLELAGGLAAAWMGVTAGEVSTEVPALVIIVPFCPLPVWSWHGLRRARSSRHLDGVGDGEHVVLGYALVGVDHDEQVVVGHPGDAVADALPVVPATLVSSPWSLS